MVGDAVRYIGQALANLGSRDPQLTSQEKVELNTCLRLQFYYYIKKYPTPIQVKPTPLKVLYLIAIESTVSNNTYL